MKSFKHISFLFSLLLSFGAAQNYQSIDLTHPDGTFAAVAINNPGQIAGRVITDEASSHALRREVDGQYTPLQELAGNSSSVYGMNDLGEVVGFNVDGDGFGISGVWEETGFRELDVPLNATLVLPSDINNSGIIAGFYFFGMGYQQAAIWGTVNPLPVAASQLKRLLYLLFRLQYNFFI